VTPTPIGNLRTTWPTQGESSGTDTEERDRANIVPENSPVTQGAAKNCTPVQKPDKITMLDQTLGTPEPIQPQMTRNNKSDWNNIKRDDIELVVENNKTDAQKEEQKLSPKRQQKYSKTVSAFWWTEKYIVCTH
jgi:hypothetical protein